VSEASPLRVMSTFEPHVLRDRVTDMEAWDEIFATRLGREVIEAAVADIPDAFLTPLVDAEALRRRRAAYVAFLWKRLKGPRTWATSDDVVERPRRTPPAWLR
jgi:hypothetical protein